MRGRTFSRNDYSTSAAPVLVCSEALAQKLFPNEDPIGQHVQFGSDRIFEIVGMVGDIKLTRILDDRPDKIYLPHTGGNGCLIVRTRVAPASQAELIRKAILEVDLDQPAANVRTLEQDVSRSVAARSQMFTLLGLFAISALGLAALGLYGVLAHAVALRRHEIGIRMALGAQRSEVLRLILRNGMRLTLLGVVLGLAGGLRADPRPVKSALSSRDDRSAHLCRRGTAASPSCSIGVHNSRPTRCQSRSDGSSQSRLKRPTTDHQLLTTIHE